MSVRSATEIDFDFDDFSKHTNGSEHSNLSNHERKYIEDLKENIKKNNDFDTTELHRIVQKLEPKDPLLPELFGLLRMKTDMIEQKYVNRSLARKMPQRGVSPRTTKKNFIGRIKNYLTRRKNRVAVESGGSKKKRNNRARITKKRRY